MSKDEAKIKRRIIQIVATSQTPERGSAGTTTLYALADDGTLWGLREYKGYNPDTWYQITPLPSTK